MGRTLSSPTATAVAKTFTQPGYLVQLGFSAIQRFSSRGDEPWNGFTWLGNNVVVSQQRELPNGSVAIGLTIGNTDLAFGAVCLNEPPQEKAVSIWAFYEGATATADPVLMFSGVIESCDINEQMVQLQLSPLNAATLFIPRERITRAAGFSRLLPAGRVIQFGGVSYEIVKAY